MNTLSSNKYLYALCRILPASLKEFHLSGKNTKQIAQSFKSLHLKKGEVFSLKGKINNRVGILLNGTLYANFESAKNVEEVSRFFFLPDNFIVCNLESLKNKTPSNETIRAINDCELLCIEYEDLQRLYSSIPQMNFIGRQLAELSYIKAAQRIHDLQALDAKHRAEIFFRKFPDLYKIVPRQLLASYLKMNRNLVTQYYSEMKK